MGLTDPLKEKQGWRIVTAAAVAGTVGIGGLIFAGQDGGGEALAGPISLQDRVPVTSEAERQTPYRIVGSQVKLAGTDSASDSPFDEVVNFGSASASADTNDSPDVGAAQSGAFSSDSPEGVSAAPRSSGGSWVDGSSDSPDVAPQPARSSAPAPGYVSNSADSASFDSPS